MEITWEFYVQAIVAMVMITAPPDPAKVLLFNSSLVDDSSRTRATAALRVATIVFVVLAVTALVGREILQLLGINLGAFGVAGGLVVAAMGFEMLYGGETSRAQGSRDPDIEQMEDDAVAGEPEDALVIPLSIPLIAGPGSITTMITIVSVEDSGAALLAGVGGALAVAVLAFASYMYLGDVISRVSDTTTTLLLRVGGILLATIGIQLLLGGIRDFYSDT